MPLRQIHLKEKTMCTIRAMAIGFLTMSVCMAQTVVSHINGIVTDTGTTPIAGAAVSLEKNGLTATSGADGSFTLTGMTGAIDRNIRPLPQGPSATIHNGVFYINTMEKAALEITSYDLKGQVVASVRKTLDAGTNLLPLRQQEPGLFLYRVNIDKKEFMIKGASLCGVTGGAPVSLQNRSVRTAAVASPINDVIAVRKSGYLNYRVVVTSSDTSGIEIKLIVCADTLTDADGNVYQAVRIGNQVWMAENLRVTKYNDGTAIPLVIDTLAWFSTTTPAYCYYYKNTVNETTIKKYGALYNWYVVGSTNPKKIAPAGWHVPTDSEWTILVNYLVLHGFNWDGTTNPLDTGEYNRIAKSLAAKADWFAYTTTGSVGCDLTKNNRSGFSALPAGGAGGAFYGGFFGRGSSGYWWSCTGRSINGLAYYLNWSYIRLYQLTDYSKRTGFSVRLVKD